LLGDYDQSIYAFNGANIENIATFRDRYRDATVFTLTKTTVLVRLYSI